MTEAAFAWRSGLTARARELASHARRLWARAGMPPPALLMRCLAVAAGDATSTLELEELLRAATRCPLPRISAQCLGLLAPFNVVRAGERAPISLPSGAPRSIPEDRWGLASEVLSLREVTRACEAAERAPRPASGRPRFKSRSARPAGDAALAPRHDERLPAEPTRRCGRGHGAPMCSRDSSSHP